VCSSDLATVDDINTAFGLGAVAALLGTRFVASQESNAHDIYKQALIDADADATVRSLCFDGVWPDAPHRTLKNSTYRMWDAAGRPSAGARPGEGDIVVRTDEGMSLPRYSMALAGRGMTGEPEATALYAGTGVGSITDCPPAAQIIADMVEGLSARQAG